MTERYEPPSDFLKALIDDETPLSGSDHAAADLRRLIDLTRDASAANRDWAAFLLAQQDIDTHEVREALLAAADDENEYVSAEAIWGLAQRDKALALPFLQRALSGQEVAVALFEAAEVVAHPSLVADLQAFTEPSGDDYLDMVALDALKACEGKN